MGKTYRGRVVYNRKLHPFTYTDVLRIIRRVDPLALPENERLKTAGAAAAAVLAAWSDYLTALKAIDAPLRVDVAPDFALRIGALLLDTVSILPEKAGEILQAVRDSLVGGR